MWGWNWLFGAEKSSAADEIGPKMPSDFDECGAWEAVFGGDCDEDLEDYNRNRREEKLKKAWFQILLTITIVGFGVYVIKK